VSLNPFSRSRKIFAGARFILNTLFIICTLQICNSPPRQRPVSQAPRAQDFPARNELKLSHLVFFCNGAKRREKKMKKLALCALVLGAGLAASRADVSLGIRIGIDDRHAHHADYRSSHHHNYYRAQPPVVHCEPVVVACPVCAREGVQHRPWYRGYADHRRYIVAEPVCPPRPRGW